MDGFLRSSRFLSGCTNFKCRHAIASLCKQLRKPGDRIRAVLCLAYASLYLLPISHRWNCSNACALTANIYATPVPEKLNKGSGPFAGEQSDNSGWSMSIPPQPRPSLVELDIHFLIRAMRSNMEYVTPSEKTAWITRRGGEIGFDLCGIARAEDWPELAQAADWLARGYAGEMAYLHNPRRKSPASALPGAQSIIVCALNYNTPRTLSIEAAAMNGPDSPSNGNPQSGPRGWISRYAWGDDYHRVLSERLDVLLTDMRANFNEPFYARAYVDTGPLPEKVAAKHAGLGWLAKNTCLINERAGSWLFLGVILTTLDCAPSVTPGEPLPADLCGNCTLCIEACPTAAITEPYVLDAQRCISYLTIELRDAIPEELRTGIGRMVFGCDICQDVCPWNRKSPTTSLTEFLPREIPAAPPGHAGNDREASASLFAPPLAWLASLNEKEFSAIFRGSPIRRAKWRGMIRNVCVALGNSPVEPGSPAYERIMALLARLSASADEIIAEHARWAFSRLKPAGSPQAIPANSPGTS
jgi:epoxyqueuosine reductase